MTYVALRTDVRVELVSSSRILSPRQSKFERCVNVGDLWDAGPRKAPFFLFLVLTLDNGEIIKTRAVRGRLASCMANPPTFGEAVIPVAASPCSFGETV